MSFRYQDLRGASFAGRRFEAASFEGAVLAEADLRGADLIEVDLRACDLEGADLSGALLHTCDLSRADLARARFTRATLVDCSFDGSAAERAILDDVLLFPNAPGALAPTPGAAEGPTSRAAVLRLMKALRCLALGGDLDDAAATAAAASGLAPGWSRPYRALGDLERRRGRLAPAAEAYRKALDRAPGDGRATRALARCLTELGQHEGALALLSALNAGAPGDVATLRELGFASSRAGRFAEARAALTEAERYLRARGAEDIDLWLQIAAVEASSGRSHAAFARFRHVLAAAPERLDALRDFGEFCERCLDAPESAHEAYARYLERSPEDRAIWLRQARVLSTLGDAGGVLEALARAEALPAADSPRAVADLAAARSARPELLERTFQFATLADETRAHVDGGDVRLGLLHARALLALGDARLDDCDQRLDARPDLHDDARIELRLRRSMRLGADASIAAAGAAGPSTFGELALTARESPNPTITAQLDRAVAELLIAARRGGLVDPAVERATGATLSSYGSLLVSTAAPGGAPLLLEVLFGRQRGHVERSLALEAELASRGVALHRAPLDPEGALTGYRGSSVAGLSTSPANLPPSSARAAPAAAELTEAGAAVVRAGLDAGALVDVPLPARRRIAGAIAAAWERTRRGRVALAGTEPLFLVPPTRAGGPDAPLFAGGAIAGPAWLAAIATVLGRDADRATFDRYRALPPDPPSLDRLARSARDAGVNLAGLEAGAVRWLVGHCLAEAEFIIDAEPALGAPARGFRMLSLEMIAFRLELIARGLLAASLSRYL